MMSRPTDKVGALPQFVIGPCSAIDAKPVENLFKLFVIDVVGGMEMLGFGEELERIVAGFKPYPRKMSSNGWRSWA